MRLHVIYATDSIWTYLSLLNFEGVFVFLCRYRDLFIFGIDIIDGLAPCFLNALTNVCVFLTHKPCVLIVLEPYVSVVCDIKVPDGFVRAVVV